VTANRPALGGLLRSEALKAATMPATYGLLAAILAMTALNTALPLSDLHATLAVAQTVHHALSGGRDFTVLFVALGAVGAATEFRHGTAIPTFLATPRRGRVLFAKVVVGILLGALYAVFAVISTVGPAAGVLTGFGIDTKLGETNTWALLGRIVLAFIVWALIGIGVGTLVRNQVAAIVIVLAFTQFIEPIARVAASFVKGLSDVTRFFPGAASDTLVGQSIYNSALASPGGTQAASGHPLEWWVGGLVLLGYAVVFLIVGYLASWRRDVS